MAVKITMAPQLKVTAQTVLVSQLLRLADADVEAAIAREIIENPALEPIGTDWQHGHTLQPRDANHDDRRMSLVDEDDDADDIAERIAAREPVRDQLIQQARLLVPQDAFAGVTYLIHSLDEHGLLTTPAEELARESGLSHALIEHAIAWLQQLDPPGVGARDVKECLQLQCLALEDKDLVSQTVRRILEHAWDSFTKQDWQRVARLTSCSVLEVHEAVRCFRDHFYLFPLSLAANAGDDEPVLHRPDLIVWNSLCDGVAGFSVEVPAADAIHLRISPIYTQAAHTRVDCLGSSTPTERAWIQEAVGRARMFINALEQRCATLRQIGEFLVTYQVDFFTSGRRHLKPLTRADAAHALGLHPSTVSRAVSDKILQLPNGRMIQLCELFDASLAAKEAIRELLANSSAPISDNQIAEHLRAQSFDLSRRTVTQYREELGIPSRSIRNRSQALAGNST